MEKTVDVNNLQEYNIYAGLGGGYGGARYQCTTLAESEDDAMDEAYAIACDDYDAYVGIHGLRSYDDIAEDEGLDPNEDIEEIEEIYNQEREDWVDYYVVLTSEDTNVDPDEIVRDYVIEDSNGSEG